jgi:hypothetical protein
LRELKGAFGAWPGAWSFAPFCALCAFESTLANGVAVDESAIEGGFEPESIAAGAGATCVAGIDGAAFSMVSSLAIGQNASARPNAAGLTLSASG